MLNLNYYLSGPHLKKSMCQRFPPVQVVQFLAVAWVAYSRRMLIANSTMEEGSFVCFNS